MKYAICLQVLHPTPDVPFHRATFPTIGSIEARSRESALEAALRLGWHCPVVSDWCDERLPPLGKAPRFFQHHALAYAAQRN